MIDNPQIALHKARIAEFEEAERKALETQQQKEVVPVLPPTEDPALPVVEEVPPVTTEPNTDPDVKDIEYWKAEAERNAKRRKDGERGLHEALQAKSHLTTELEHTKNNLAQVDSLKAELEQIKAMLATKPAVPSVTISEQMFDSDFEETYPDIASNLKKVTQSMKSDYDKRLEEITRQFEESKKAVAEQEAKAYEAKHFAAVKALHPDAELFFGDKYGPALLAWVETKPQFYRGVVANPLGHTPEDVASIISDFKREAGLNKQAPKPASGDIGFKAGKTQTITNPSTIQPLTNEEIRNFNTLFHNVRFDAAKKDLLLQRLKLTEELNSN